MSLEGLQERLSALQETATQIRDLIDRLATLEFQPGSVPLGNDEESSPSGELSAEIGLTLRGGLEEQELLREEIKYLRPESHDKARLKDGVERLGVELAGYRAAFRKARLAAKKSLEQAQRQERELLVRSFSLPASESASLTSAHDETAATAHRAWRQSHQHQQTSLSEEDRQTVGASSNVTNALRRTHDLIAAELSRSEYAHQTLTESSAALKQLDESYASLDSMLANSRDLLGTLLRSQKSDTWYLQTALYMLLVTAAWLVFRRILYGPLWWLVWLPLRVLFGVGTKAGSSIIHSRGSPGEPIKDSQAGGPDAKAHVDGLPDDDLPTVRTGRETRIARHEQERDPDSMVEKMGEMLDAADDESGTVGAGSGVDGHQGNTKKRMWVETQGVGDDAPARDEL